MLSHDEMAQIIAAPPTGHKQSVEVRVDFIGGDKQNPDNYTLSFKGTGTTPEGILVCLGPSGTSIGANRYVFTFQAIGGKNLREASFVNPGSPPAFDFVAGIIENDADPCTITPNATEFIAPVTDARERVVFVDLKANSGHLLGYKFTVWATHYDGTVFPKPCDPRIINK